MSFWNTPTTPNQQGTANSTPAVLPATQKPSLWDSIKSGVSNMVRNSPASPSDELKKVIAGGLPGIYAPTTPKTYGEAFKTGLQSRASAVTDQLVGTPEELAAHKQYIDSGYKDKQAFDTYRKLASQRVGALAMSFATPGAGAEGELSQAAKQGAREVGSGLTLPLKYSTEGIPLALSKGEQAIVQAGKEEKQYAPIKNIAQGYTDKNKFIEDFYTPQSYDLNPGATRLEKLPETGQYHGASITNLKSILDSGKLKTSVSRLDNAGENVISLSGSRGVAHSYGPVFKIKNAVDVYDAPDGTTKGETYKGFEYRHSKDIPLDNIENVTLPLNKSEGLNTKILWNFSNGKTPEYISAEELGKQFEKKGIKVIYNDGILGDEQKLSDIFDQSNAQDGKASRLSQMPQKTGIVQSIKEALNPVAHLDPASQKIFHDWNTKIIQSRVAANGEIGQLNIPEDKGWQAILDRQAGVQTPETKAIATKFDTLLKNERDAGFTVPEKQNYVPHVWEKFPDVVKYLESKGLTDAAAQEYMKGGELEPEVAKRLGVNPTFTKESVFPDYKTGMEYDGTPKFTHPEQLAAHNVEQIGKNLANRDLITQLTEAGKIVPASSTHKPLNFVPVNLEFSPHGYYAEPKIGNILNGIFRSQSNASFPERLVHAGARASSLAQEITLSAGIPRTNQNFFSTGQMIKESTAGNPKAIVAFLRANSNDASKVWFTEKAPVIQMMANQGIDETKNIANYQNAYKNLVHTFDIRKLGDIKGVIGEQFNKAFNEKTFNSFMPQMHVQLFEDTYKGALAKGMSSQEAQKLAGDVTKKQFGLTGFTGRAKWMEDMLTAFFFAPKYREGIANVLKNTGAAGIDMAKNVGGMRAPLNPSLAANRKLLIGMAITFAGYDALNYKLNGHHIWQNPKGREFAVRVPLPNKDVMYIDFMPGFLSFARNMVQGSMSLAGGDIKDATQKFGSVLSVPIKTMSEVYANKDYFGNPIYKDTDSPLDQRKKIAQYIGVTINHPYVGEAIKYFQGKKPAYQAASAMLEAPLKFSSTNSEEANKIFDYKDQQLKESAQFNADAQKEYDKMRALPDKAQRQAYLKNLLTTDRKTFDKIIAISKQDNNGLTKNEGYIKSLNPEFRAKWVYDNSKDMSTGERKAYLTDLLKKKVITSQTLLEFAKLNKK
jgi:hypothetical protein